LGVRADTTGLLEGIDTVYGARRGTARNDALKAGWNGADSTFVWYVGRV
jgi:hypothetical protein